MITFIIFLAVGVTCQSNQDCASLPNSLCTSNLCVCKYNYVPHPEEQICLERKYNLISVKSYEYTFNVLLKVKN